MCFKGGIFNLFFLQSDKIPVFFYVCGILHLCTQAAFNFLRKAFYRANCLQIESVSTLVMFFSIMLYFVHHLPMAAAELEDYLKMVC